MKQWIIGTDFGFCKHLRYGGSFGTGRGSMDSEEMAGKDLTGTENEIRTRRREDSCKVES